MRLIPWAVAAALALASCAVTPAVPDAPNGPVRCDAEANRTLIGSHSGAVDFAPGANVRLVCASCAMTKEYVADRLTVRFDLDTGIIESVDCG